MNKTSEWNDIMDAFRGRRLAVHTDLANGNHNMVNRAELKTQEALGWLVFNRLVRVDGDVFSARSPIEARKIWMEQGPAKEVAGRLFSNQTFASPTPAPTAQHPNCELPEVQGSHENCPSCNENRRTANVVVPIEEGLPAAAEVHPRKPQQEELFS